MSTESGRGIAWIMTKDEERAKRLANALRANLRRRKAPDRVLEEPAPRLDE